MDNMDNTDNEMKQYVWRNGEKPERSYKTDKTTTTALDEIPNTILTEKESLRHRDEANNKLNMRYMVQQVSQNPFLQGTNYIDDLENQERYLRPKQHN